MTVRKAFDPKSDHALRLTVVARTTSLADALTEAFATASAAEVVEGDLFDLTADALVSPANSTGDMSGGIDRAIDALYDHTAQPTVRDAIAEHHLGELPVGAALITRYPNHRFPALISAPTMRAPGAITGTLNTYLALRAALVAAWRDPEIHHVVTPGLGTGVGRLDPHDAARQMRAAYDSVIAGGWRRARHPAQLPFATHAS